MNLSPPRLGCSNPVPIMAFLAFSYPKGHSRECSRVSLV
jgi:hypothetical protein